MKAWIATLAAAALVAAPAAAKERKRHHRQDDGVGAFIAGALIAGGLVALLAKKKDTVEPAALPELSPDETGAANLCADAVERQLADDDREARVERFNAVSARAQGGYKVTGAIRVADAGDGYRMRFSCTVKNAEVRSVTLSI